MGGTEGSASGASSKSSAPQAQLRIVSADATPEEVAAIVAVLASLGGEEPARTPRREWGAPHRQVRRTLAHGPDGWRASTLPR